MKMSLKSDNVEFVRYSKWPPVKKFRCQESIRVIIIYPHEMALKSDNAEFVRYCGGHFENGDR
jgi:hypothetical protein